MGLRINDTIPDLKVETDQGELSLHDWIGDSWAILFSHPKDFTPVCTTEFGAVAKLSDEWEKRGCKVIWLNPLKGWADYAPVAKGMAAALPYLDAFKPAHTLADLAALEQELATL